MDWLQVVVLALLQGLTEFLPISSSAHLILPAQLFGWADQGLAFDMVVHLGTLMAVIGYFRHELQQMTAGSWQGLQQRRLNADLHLLLMVGLATVPAVLAGFFAKDLIAGQLRDETVVIATTTVLFAGLLGLAELTGSHRRQMAQIGAGLALLIGLFQVLALVPGTSRSGITITAGLLLGLTRQDAARFSFLLSIPVILGACLLMLLDLLTAPVAVAWRPLLLAFVLAAIAAYATIHFFLALLERVGMMPFVIYRLLLGTVLFAFFV